MPDKARLPWKQGRVPQGFCCVYFFAQLFPANLYTQ